MAKVMIFGAGKIARGFLGQLMFLSGTDFAFVEKFESLASLLKEGGQYTVNVLGAPEKNSLVTGFRAYAASEKEAIAAEMQDAQVVFTAVGGKNLVDLAPDIALALQAAGRPINVITCENWKKPAAILKTEIEKLAPQVQAGFAESVVMRSAIEPTPEQLAQDPLTVNVQNFWRLPVDGDALIAPLPDIQGIEPMANFQGFLERKFYTYNAANGTVSFLGSLYGLTHICESANDPRVAEVLEKVYLETGEALAKKYGISLEEQLAFAATSRMKLRDPVIVDTLERNARDPLRKLGPDDRLVGSARLAENYGVKPEGLATAIAAAIHYVSPGDPSAEKLADMRSTVGTAGILEEICKIRQGETLFDLVLEKEKELGLA